MFLKNFLAAWEDVDCDGRFRGSRLLERATDVRLMFFAEHGFPVELLRKQHLVPALLKERIDYLRDIEVMAEFKINLTLAGRADDGSRFALRAEFVRSDGKTAARVTSTCEWLDTGLRKFVLPPPQLFRTLEKLPMNADYQVLPNATK